MPNGTKIALGHKGLPLSYVPSSQERKNCISSREILHEDMLSFKQFLQASGINLIACKYTPYLISAEIKELEEGKLYIRKIGDTLIYSVITPSGKIVREQPIRLDVSIPEPLTVDNLQALLPSIMFITAENGHTDDLYVSIPIDPHKKDDIITAAPCVNYSPDGNQLAIGYEDHNIILRTCPEEQRDEIILKIDKNAITILPNPFEKRQVVPGRATSLDFSPDSKLFASAYHQERTVKIWSVETPDCQFVLDLHHPVDVQHVKWSPLYTEKRDSKEEKSNTVIYSLVSGSSEGAVRLWQLKKTATVKKTAMIREAKRATKIEYKPQLLWQTHATLFCHDASLMRTMRLSESNYKLLIQRGAKRGNSYEEKKIDERIANRDADRKSEPTAVFPPSKFTISKDQWVVSLAREKICYSSPSTIHTMLILQGIDFNSELSQHFLVIKEIHFFEDAAIEIRDISRTFMEKQADNLFSKSFQISRESADKLLLDVIRDQRNSLNYAYLGSRFFRKTYYNCLTYCEAKLRGIGIHPGTESLFDLVAAIPSLHLPAPPKNRTCIIS